MVADIYKIINVGNVYAIHTICSVARCGHHMFDSYICYWNNISSVIILFVTCFTFIKAMHVYVTEPTKPGSTYIIRN
jgi:hypothetical protein